MLSAGALQEMADRGLHPAAAARVANVSRWAVGQAELRHGLRLPRVEILRVDHREAAQDMKALDAVEYLLDVIEAIITPLEVDLAWAWPGAHLCPQEKRLLRVLALSRLPVNRATLFGALNGDRAAPPMEGDGKIVDVILCKLRKKIAGAGVRIVNDHGVGWSVAPPAGFVWPWEAPE